MHPSAQSRGRSESGTKDRPVLKKGQVTINQYSSGAMRKSNSLEKENHSGQSKIRRDRLPESRPLPPDRARSDKPQSARSAEPKLRRTSSPHVEHKTTSRIHQLETQVSKEKKINSMLSNCIEEKQTKILDLEKKNGDREKALKATADLLAQVRREDDEKYAALNEQYITVRDQKQRVVEENRTNLKTLKKSEAKVAEEKLKVTQLEADVEKLRSNNTNHKDRVQDIIAQKSKAEKELEKMKQEKVKVVAEKMKVIAENIMVLEEKDTLIADLKKLKEQVGSSPSKDEVAKLKGQLQEVRNTRRRDKYAYESENKSLTKKLADSEEVEKYLNAQIVNVNEGLTQKEVWVERLTKRMENEDLLKEKIQVLQKLSNSVWTLNRSYLKVFEKMGVVRKLGLKDAFKGLKPTLKRMTSPEFVTITVRDELVLPNLDVELKEAKEKLAGYRSTFNSDKQEAAKDRKRRYPSDSSLGTASSSDSSEQEYGEPAKVIKKEW